jgi:hypothetical protein
MSRSHGQGYCQEEYTHKVHESNPTRLGCFWEGTTRNILACKKQDTPKIEARNGPGGGNQGPRGAAPAGDTPPNLGLIPSAAGISYKERSASALPPFGGLSSSRGVHLTGETSRTTAPGRSYGDR